MTRTSSIRTLVFALGGFLIISGSSTGNNNLQSTTASADDAFDQAHKAVSNGDSSTRESALTQCDYVDRVGANSPFRSTDDPEGRINYEVSMLTELFQSLTVDEGALDVLDEFVVNTIRSFSMDAELFRVFEAADKALLADRVYFTKSDLIGDAELSSTAEVRYSVREWTKYLEEIKAIGDKAAPTLVTMPHEIILKIIHQRLLCAMKAHVVMELDKRIVSETDLGVIGQTTVIEGCNIDVRMERAKIEQFVNRLTEAMNELIARFQNHPGLRPESIINKCLSIPALAKLITGNPDFVLDPSESPVVPAFIGVILSLINGHLHSWVLTSISYYVSGTKNIADYEDLLNYALATYLNNKSQPGGVLENPKGTALCLSEFVDILKQSLVVLADFQQQKNNLIESIKKAFNQEPLPRNAGSELNRQKLKNLIEITRISDNA